MDQSDPQLDFRFSRPCFSVCHCRSGICFWSHSANGAPLSQPRPPAWVRGPNRNQELKACYIRPVLNKNRAIIGAHREPLDPPARD